jgi:hypothetical protein
MLKNGDRGNTAAGVAAAHFASCLFLLFRAGLVNKISWNKSQLSAYGRGGALLRAFRAIILENIY